VNRRHLIFTICLVIQILFTFTLSIFAENEVQIDLANNVVSNETNEVRPLTLEEQKQQVADAIKNANNKLSYVDGEISQTMIEIQTLNDQIATYKANQEKTNADYNTLLSQITQSENEIAALEDSYEKNFSLMEERLVAFYKRGEISYTDVLFSSTDIIDFFSNYFIIQ
jgi:peptidoglycan hydrolase CwlO-like protein